MKLSGLRHALNQLAGLVAVSLPWASASAAEQCFTAMTLTVPNNSEGLYLNLATGASGPSEASVPGFDLNLYAAVNSSPSGQLKFYWGQDTTGAAGVVSAGDSYAVLGAGAQIGPASLYSRAAFTGDTSAWQMGTTGYLGLRFLNESGNPTSYGWIVLSTSASLGFPATIDGWCFEDSGGAITTPPVNRILVDGFEG